jgi:hypothetical protein
MSPQESSSPPQRRFKGPWIVLWGIVIVLLITGFVIVRIIQTSGPGPDPSTIPERPTATP